LRRAAERSNAAPLTLFGGATLDPVVGAEVAPSGVDVEGPRGQAGAGHDHDLGQLGSAAAEPLATVLWFSGETTVNQLYISQAAIDWDEPYRDGGPDAAHARLKDIRVAS
jgi:hypothetical protein